MTAAGHSALESELKHRISVERPRLIQRVQEAIADDTNLAENSDYQIAKAEQQTNEARIVELEDKLARAEVIDVSNLFGDTIKFGATVTLIDEDTDEKKVWQIVGEPEADVTNGKISVNSPVGLKRHSSRHAAHHRPGATPVGLTSHCVLKSANACSRLAA